MTKENGKTVSFRLGRDNDFPIRESYIAQVVVDDRVVYHGSRPLERNMPVIG